MLDLPPISAELDQLKQEIALLKRGKQQGHYRPHKLVMLLVGHLACL